MTEVKGGVAVSARLAYKKEGIKGKRGGGTRATNDLAVAAQRPPPAREGKP